MASPYTQASPFSPSDIPSTSEVPSRSVSDLPQSQVDAIIRTKRKAREPKACYPCHARKVKCDRNLPCDGCVKRDHADLCSYERPSKKRTQAFQESPVGGASAGSSVEQGAYHAYEDSEVPIKPDIGPNFSSRNNGTRPGGRISIAREEWDNVRNRLREMESTISSLRVGLERAEEAPHIGTDGGAGSIPNGDTDSGGKAASPEREGIHTSNTLGKGTVHLGSRSVLAYILNNKSGSDQLQTLLEDGILPKLGLDNESATYPFVDLWSTDMSSFDISAVCSALPSDQQCREFFYYYKDIAGAIYPVLDDCEQFQETLELLLQNRTASGGVYRENVDEAQKPFGVNIAFLGLLFAVLASGCQSSDLGSKERELTSQVYVCCSYQCLRMTNFLSQPTIEAIQTLLVIGNVLSYNMNPGISYVLLGMTLRMGLALGLHVESSRFSPLERYRRRHVWWSMAWQDSHFSLSYDRPSTTAVSQPEIAYREGSTAGDLSYFETLCRVISLALEVVRIRMLSPHTQITYESIQAYKERIQRIMIEAKPHLRDAQYCSNSTEHLERVVLKLHSSYFSSELCRPSLKPTADANNAATASMRRDCVSNLMTTVEAYVEMYHISSHAARSWIALQRAISSAFLLAVVEEAKMEPRVWNLLRQLESIIAQRASHERAYDTSDVTSSSSGMPSRSPGVLTYDPITGATNPTGSALPTVDSTSPATVNPDNQTQWAKSLAKTHRALQKLLTAFGTQHARSATGTSTAFSQSTHHPAQSTTTGTFAPAVSASMTPSLGSLPPPTPESSGSGEWTMPNILDRASEYIHPPLWG
ncbi:Cellobiose response regulator ClbR2-like protein [Penicillium ucsense]|uniref:Cellobiose response regulator ClbR2-like protein n=1 Tax=Penicillium ucsense TaxID=2839758 RepID=A0A8J8W4M1_9EURO|nr:Cellobiose response regulator ClbR2-like protein [Penicillium ucsense]KAF7734066.1 Cellobiose response regulator ClbR2-like protein [Penicillium ucsense]